jgi:hypothetical protein
MGCAYSSSQGVGCVCRSDGGSVQVASRGWAGLVSCEFFGVLG